MRKRILILGGGITGLSLGFYLQRQGHEIEILEQGERVGGHLETVIQDGFHFETGPRTFQTSRSAALLALIEDLGLGSEIITSSVKGRYILRKGTLVRVPSLSLLLAMAPALLKEWRTAPDVADETIWDFATRRFGKRVAEQVFDPMTLGVYAGDCRALSIEACFPKLKTWEREEGSVMRGFLKRGKSQDTLFSLRRGVASLVAALEERLAGRIVYRQRVESMENTKEGMAVFTCDTRWEAEHVFSTLPVEQVSYAGVIVINLGYASSVLSKQGFGYLVPQKEREAILGVVFDSNIFPHHNRHPAETRLTVMMKEEGESEQSVKQKVLEALRKHLKIEAVPDVVRISRKPSAIPQYTLGHLDRMRALQERSLERFPRLTLLGPALHGVSVNDCIQAAKTAVMNAL